MIDLQETGRIKDAIDKDPENYQQIIDGTRLGICITNEDGNYTAVNNTYLAILGYAREEMVGKSFLMVVPPAQKEELKEMHDEFIELQIEIFEEFAILNKKGERIKINVDAGFSDKVEGKPHKLTFIDPIA